MHVYQERYRKEDEQVLRDFFGPAEQGRRFLLLIEDFEADRFRPLDNYLRGVTENTDDTNIELLAWLIDFKHRPFEFGNNVILSDEELSLIDDSVNDPEEPPATPSPEPADPTEEENEGLGTNAGDIVDPLIPEVEKDPEPETLSLADSGKKTEGKFKKAAIVFLITAISFGGVYIFQQYGKAGETAYGNTNTGCMYWSEDHYEKVPCAEKSKGRFFVPLNEERMKNFRKITRADTITDWSIGKAYYLKNNNTIEYYTEGGIHPIYVTDTLKVLSRYMFDKYLHKKEVLVKDSLANKK